MSRSYRILTGENYAYFVTWTIVSWLRIFVEEPYRNIALESLAYMRTNKNTELNAFVVMPSHIHAILRPGTGRDLSEVIRDFKRFTSRAISGEAQRHGRKDLLAAFAAARVSNRAQSVSKYQVWQEGSHPEAVFSEGFAKQKLDYIHQNPVRAGLVETAVAWPYSSAGAYLLGEDIFPPIDLLIVS